MGIGFTGAKTSYGTAHILGILLMNIQLIEILSNNNLLFVLFEHNFVQTVHWEDTQCLHLELTLSYSLFILNFIRR